MFDTVDDIKLKNRQAGYYFFSKDTIRFFKSRIGDTVYKGKYFITSEQEDNNLRLYTIREALENGRIKTVGEFQEYDTHAQAVRAIKNME